MKKVLLAGTFDIIHPGHLYLLKQAKKRGDFLIVVIARDKTVKKEKGYYPYFNEKERVKNLKKLHLANRVLLGHPKDKLKIVVKLKPDVICLGYDQKATPKLLKKKLVKFNFYPHIVRLSSLKPRQYKTSLLHKNNLVAIKKYRSNYYH